MRAITDLFCGSFKWVEAEGFGDGGPTWVEDHIESFVNVAGPLLVRSAGETMRYSPYLYLAFGLGSGRSYQEME